MGTIGVFFFHLNQRNFCAFSNKSFRIQLFAIEPKDTPTKLQSAECKSLIESLANCFTFDIASVEAKHSSNREMTLLNNRGWLPSLQFLTSKFVCKYVGQLSERFKFVFKPDSGDFANTNSKEKKRQNQTARSNMSKKRPGGGGAWRAFCHANAQGQQFTVASLQKLSQEYMKLSVEEKQKYVEAGAAAVLARKHGHESFEKVDKRRVEKHPCVGDVTPSGAIVAADRKSDLELLVQYEGKDTFLDGYEKLKLMLKKERGTDVDNALSDKEEERLAKFEASTEGVGAVSKLQELGQDKAASTIQMTGSNTKELISLEWFPPVASICQADVCQNKLLTLYCMGHYHPKLTNRCYSL